MLECEKHVQKPQENHPPYRIPAPITTKEQNDQLIEASKSWSCSTTFLRQMPRSSRSSTPNTHVTSRLSRAFKRRVFRDASSSGRPELGLEVVHTQRTSSEGRTAGTWAVSRGPAKRHSSRGNEVSQWHNYILKCLRQMEVKNFLKPLQYGVFTGYL